MRNIPIAGKFLAIMGVFGVFSIASTLYSAGAMSAIDAGYTSLIERSDKGAIFMARANRSLQAARASMGELILANSPEGRSVALKEIAASVESFGKFTDIAIGVLPENADLPTLKARGLAILTRDCAPAVDAARSTSGAPEGNAAALFLNVCQPKLNAFSPDLVRTTDAIIQASTAKSQHISDDTAWTITSTFCGVLAGLALVLVAGYGAVRRFVVAPLQGLSGQMSDMAAGDLTLDVAGTDRRDEIGGMARSVDVFKQAGLQARAVASAAEEARAATETDRQRTMALERQRAEDMAVATSGMAAGLKHLAGGDLSFRIDDPFAPDFETLRTDFNAAVAQLAETLSHISEATRTIDNGSREIRTSAEDLSRRTEQQAASLEETAAALDQITSNVSSASKRTEEARSVALEANHSARQSGIVVANAVDAMERIEQSSTQISNIIGVIDEIAFQTNLLALNAGVEAARAGEAGKGFAVVAQEVRELAQRSAQAAKEIKALIRASGSEVANGVKLVRETGDALKVIEAHVVTINSQLDAIATSAREQATGLVEVNTAVNQMDQVTQQNAAMVEESTAASAALAAEALRMQHLVGQFRVTGGTVGSAPSGAGSRGVQRPAAVTPHSAPPSPVASPARQMMQKVARAVGLSAAAAPAEHWEEF